MYLSNSDAGTLAASKITLTYEFELYLPSGRFNFPHTVVIFGILFLLGVGNV